MTPASQRFAILLVVTIVMLFAAGRSMSEDWAFEDSIEAVVEQINAGSSQAFSDAVDTDALLRRVFDGVEINEKLKAGFSQTIGRSKNQLGENIIRRMPAGSYAKVVAVEQKGDKATALVRYDYGNRGLGYHAYELNKDKAGNVRIVDWLDYLDGSRYSDALRLSAVSFEPTAASVWGLVPEHHGSDDEYAKFAEVILAYRDKDFQKFYNASASLTLDLRRSRFMHMLTCQVSKMTGDQNLYINAYRELSKNFGNDPTVALSLLNYYFSKGDYEDVMSSLRLLQQEFGVRDAALLSLMSRTALGMRNAEEAAVLADEAISIEPGLEAPYWAAIAAHVVLKHHGFAVMTAKSLEEQFGKSLDREQFENNSLYSEFIRSPEFEEWQSGKD